MFSKPGRARIAVKVINHLGDRVMKVFGVALWSDAMVSAMTKTKKGEGKLCGNDAWTVVSGALTTPPGRPGKIKSLFKAIGEKIPFEFLTDIKRKLEKDRILATGVYIAHDSMGYPRYIGRGNIFNRLDACQKAQRT
jgi:hypothetical protein